MNLMPTIKTCFLCEGHYSGATTGKAFYIHQSVSQPISANIHTPPDASITQSSHLNILQFIQAQKHRPNQMIHTCNPSDR